MSREIYVALVKKTRRGGVAFLSPGGAPGWIPRTGQVRAAKRQKEERDSGGSGREDKEEKSERNLKTDAVLACVRRYQRESEVVERDHPARYSPTDLDPGCSPRRTHEAEKARATTLVISANNCNFLYERAITKID